MKTLCQFITCKVNYQNVGLADVNEFVAISLEYPSGRELICYFSCILYWYGNLKEIVYLDPTVGDMRAYYTELVLLLFLEIILLTFQLLHKSLCYEG